MSYQYDIILCHIDIFFVLFHIVFAKSNLLLTSQSQYSYEQYMKKKKKLVDRALKKCLERREEAKISKHMATPENCFHSDSSESYYSVGDEEEASLSSGYSEATQSDIDDESSMSSFGMGGTSANLFPDGRKSSGRRTRKQKRAAAKVRRHAKSLRRSMRTAKRAERKRY